MLNPLRALFEAPDIRQGYKLSGLQDWSLFGGGPTKAGVTVSETTAEGLPVVFACVRTIANAIAAMPCKLYERQDNGTREAIEHSLYGVLHDQSNPEQTAYDTRALLFSHLMLWGSCYAEIVRDAAGRVVGLWPLLPWAMFVDRDEQRRLRFRYDAGTQPRTWIHDPDRPPIFRLMIHSLDGLTGRSPVRVLREAVGTGLASQEFASRFFGQGATMPGILSTELNISDPAQIDQIQDRINKRHQGTANAHQFLTLPFGFKYTPIAMPLDDAQFLDSRKFTRSELCGAFGVPPHMIADLERATFSNVEHESLRWLRDGLEPHLTAFEQAVRRDLLGPRSASRYYARFVRNAAVRGDLKSRSDALARMRQNGVINANEWRALEEMDPIGGEAGTVYIVNSATVPTTQAGEEAA